MKSISLKFVEGPLKGSKKDLTQRETILGSGSKAHINVPGCSGAHVKIGMALDGRVRIVDLDSRDGTFIDGERVDGEQLVTAGQMLGLGTSIAEIVVLDLSEASSAKEIHKRDRQWRVDNLIEEIREDRIGGKRIAGFVKVLLEASQPHVASMDHVAERLLEGLTETIDFDRAFVVVVEPDDSTRLIAKKTKTSDPSAVPSQTVLSQVLGDGISILTIDAQVDARFDTSRSIAGGSIRGVMCAPFFHDDQPAGALYVDSLMSECQFAGEDLALLEASACLTGKVLEGGLLWEKLQRAAKLGAIGTTATKILEEISSPLDEIRDSARNLSDEELAKRWPEARSRILVAVDTIRDVVSNTMELASGQATAEDEVDINRVLQSAISLTRPMLGAQIEMRVVSKPLPAIRGSSSHLLHLFLNLLRNAIAAVGGAGTLEIVSEPSKTGVTVHICDNGCGMEEEVIAKALGPLRASDSDGGLGLGLAMCHRVVEEHGGTMKIKSTIGKGTVVTVEVPSASATDA